MSWTDERVELLKKLWMEGHSASQIAGELGDGITRNAVIGKVHRLKLSARAKPVTSGPRARPVPRPPVPRRPLSSGTSAPRSAGLSALGSMGKPRPMTTHSVGATALAVNEAIELETYVTPASVTELFIPEAERLTLLQLTEKTCKWPIGDPLSPDFYFCGQHSNEGSPYCEFHGRRAYHQLEKRKR